jgi:hypothetical protein
MDKIASEKSYSFWFSEALHFDRLALENTTGKVN